MALHELVARDFHTAHLDQVFARPQCYVVLHFDGWKQVSELCGELFPDRADPLEKGRLLALFHQVY